MFACLTSFGVAACRDADSHASTAYEVTAQFPHDSSAYAQGLLWDDRVLFKSTGLNGRSDVRRVDLRSGRRLFTDGVAFAALHLVGTTTTSTGVVIATYEPAERTAGQKP